MIKIGNDWDDFTSEEQQKPYYQQLRAFLKQEYSTKTIYPSASDIFATLTYTPYSDVAAVILGQDPYINPGEAHGMSFSVLPAARTPPSLQNIYKELQTDLGCFIPNNGYLMPWAKQGVLLLNTVLTVQAGKSRSHAGQGWEKFTDAIIGYLNQREQPIAFLLWGKMAQGKAALITNPRHKTLTSAHPSPLAGGAFFGCKHFSKTNDFLAANGQAVIDWQIPNL